MVDERADVGTLLQAALRGQLDVAVLVLGEVAGAQLEQPLRKLLQPVQRLAVGALLRILHAHVLGEPKDVL